MFLGVQMTMSTLVKIMATEENILFEPMGAVFADAYVSRSLYGATDILISHGLQAR